MPNSLSVDKSSQTYEKMSKTSDTGKQHLAILLLLLHQNSVYIIIILHKKQCVTITPTDVQEQQDIYTKQREVAQTAQKTKEII